MSESRAKGPGPHPFRRGDMWWARFPSQRAPRPRLSLETHDKRVARARCEMLRQISDAGDWETVGHLINGTREIGAVFTAWSAQGLRDYMAVEKIRERDVDLNAYVPRWFDFLSGERVKGAPKYLRQLRTLIPEGTVFPRSEFTKASIRDWLDLRRPKTRNHYRTAASSFAEWLLERDIIEYNPALQVKRSKGSGVRCRYLTVVEATALCLALPAGPHRALHAFLLATGGDLGGALRVRYRDVDLIRGDVRIPGTKTHRRDAVRRFLAPWALAVFREYLTESPGVPLAHLFGSLLYSTPGTPADWVAEIKRATTRVHTVLLTALTAAGLSDYTTRDHRHTFAVQALRDGYSFHVVAHQLGHINTALVHKVYGKFAVNEADYTRRGIMAEPSRRCDSA